MCGCGYILFHLTQINHQRIMYICIHLYIVKEQPFYMEDKPVFLYNKKKKKKDQALYCHQLYNVLYVRVLHTLSLTYVSLDYIYLFFFRQVIFSYTFDDGTYYYYYYYSYYDYYIVQCTGSFVQFDWFCVCVCVCMHTSNQI